MAKIYKKWILAARLGTALLALASVGLGSALAAWTGNHNWLVSLLAAGTAALLQVSCNVANDYGDFVRGADPANKVKLPSAMQTGLVTPQQIKRVLPWLVGGAMGCGACLLYLAKLTGIDWIVFLVLGLAGGIASLTYTLGDKPYGYQGWGDVAVFVFFGLIGVGGTFYLHTTQLRFIWLLPAIGYGSLVTGVLNINNIRDMQADAQVGKRTLPTRIGRQGAIVYHWGLLAASIVSILIFLGYYVRTPWPYVCLCMIPALLHNGWSVSQQPPAQLNKVLQQLVRSSLIFTTLLSIGLLL